MPYVEPYYNAYAKSHVDKARPYVEKANQQLFVPAASYSRHYYTAYGAPRVEQARKFSQDKWDKVVKPQVNTAQNEAKKQYDSNLAPHVDKASAAAAPYVTASRENVYQVYSKHILPTYGSFRPHLEKAYAYLYIAVVEKSLPYAHSAWTSTIAFFDRILWPKIRVLYGENVEPQLVRIGERLGRYRDGKKMQAVMDDMESTPIISSVSATISEISSSVVSGATTSATSTSTSTPEQDAEQIRNKIESDLKNWQDKFAKAADKGMEDLQERVKEITDRQIDSQVGGTGNALLIQLEEAVGSEESKLRKKINSIVKALPEDATEESLKTAEENLSKATRAAGLSVKDKAQALRSWKENFDHETLSLVSAASNSTLEVIDNIRDLGLQEIGMKWAHMEGVTYKDWSKYHEVKKSFEEWHKKVAAIAQNHPGMSESRDASEEIEAKCLTTAEQAAKELSRLKDVGKWKIQARDYSDDFSTKYMPAAAAVGAQKVMDGASSASEQVAGTSQGTIESVASMANQKASNAASKASSQIVGTQPGYAEQAASKISEAASLASEKGSRGAPGTSLPKSESVVSAAKDKVDNFASQASEAIIGTPVPAYESIALEASEKAVDAGTAISEALGGSSTSMTADLSSTASDISSSASSMASKASKKVYGGAMAQEVKGQKPIMDDVIDEGSTYSDAMQSIVDQAGDKFADVTNAVSEAILGATKTQGTVESASSVADEQYSKALAAASSVLYGTKQGAAESATSAASDKWAEAVAA